MDFRQAVKKAEPFIALALLLTLILLAVLLYQNNVLKKEIAKSCGWGDDDLYCWCEKSEVVRLQNEMGGVEIGNVKLDG